MKTPFIDPVILGEGREREREREREGGRECLCVYRAVDTWRVMRSIDV